MTAQRPEPLQSPPMPQTATKPSQSRPPAGAAAMTRPGEGRLDRAIRRLVPAVPPLSRKGILMWPLDRIDAGISRLLGDYRAMPPNRFRIRIGAGNRLLFNQLVHRTMPVNFWLDAFASGLLTRESDILDIGSGCGRYAQTLASMSFFGRSYTGRYTGVDVDRQMVEWCRAHFPPEQFAFILAGDHSAVYNPHSPSAERTPDQSPPRWGLEPATIDFAFSVSLLTHLLEADLERVLTDVRALLRPGRAMQHTVFCLDHMNHRLGGRWTFAHQQGDAHIENERFPEAAVAYEHAYLVGLCERLGLEDIEIHQGGAQSLLRARSPQ